MYRRLKRTLQGIGVKFSPPRTGFNASGNLGDRSTSLTAEMSVQPLP